MTAVVISERGGVPYEIIEGDRVELEPIPIAINLKIPVIEIAIRRFNVLDRSQIKARSEMAETEDEKIIAAVEFGAATATGHNTVVTSTAGVTRAKLAELFVEVEKHDAPVANVLMHASQYKDFVKEVPFAGNSNVKTNYIGEDP